MKGRTASVIGVISAIAAVPAVGAAATANEPAVPVAHSYADLLQPIPNAVERLKIADSEQAVRPAELIQTQYVVHHHHHHHWRPRYRRGYVWWHGRWVRVRRHHHHHHQAPVVHHHHHHN